MKKIISLLLAFGVLLITCCAFFGCANAPRVEEIYDRVVELVESSYEINTVFYGPGLPSIKADSEYAELNHIYFGYEQAGRYEFVTDGAGFHSISAIKAAAERVYSRDFLEDVLYKAAFDGYAFEDSMGGSVFAVARYMEDGSSFFISSDPEDTRYTAMRVYDYSSMQVLSLGRSDACKVVMSSWLENTPEQVEDVSISLVLQDGQWFLDSFTGG